VLAHAAGRHPAHRRPRVADLRGPGRHLRHPAPRQAVMHLLAAQAGAAQQEGEAIDLGQTPADILFLSAADSELMMLAAAADRAGTSGLRLASILRLTHNLSVDLWIERTARHAKLIVVRLLGGAAYW